MIYDWLEWWMSRSLTLWMASDGRREGSVRMELVVDKWTSESWTSLRSVIKEQDESNQDNIELLMSSTLRLDTFASKDSNSGSTNKLNCNMIIISGWYRRVKVTTNLPPKTSSSVEFDHEHKVQIVTSILPFDWQNGQGHQLLAVGPGTLCEQMTLTLINWVSLTNYLPNLSGQKFRFRSQHFKQSFVLRLFRFELLNVIGCLV